MGYAPFPTPFRIADPDEARAAAARFRELAERYDPSPRRRSWWRTLLWCWALCRRGFWRDRHWRCGSCGRAWPQAREECPCALQGPYRSARRELVLNWPVTRNGAVPERLVWRPRWLRGVPELPDPPPPTRRSE